MHAGDAGDRCENRMGWDEMSGQVRGQDRQESAVKTKQRKKNFGTKNSH